MLNPLGLWASGCGMKNHVIRLSLNRCGYANTLSIMLYAVLELNLNIGWPGSALSMAFSNVFMCGASKGKGIGGVVIDAFFFLYSSLMVLSANGFPFLFSLSFFSLGPTSNINAFCCSFISYCSFILRCASVFLTAL